KALAKFFSLKSYSKIALYLPSDGEISPLPLLHNKIVKNINFYLPILSKLAFQGLKFGVYHPNSILAPNKFSINEPVVHNKTLKSAEQLDVILLPLVAFDAQGNRMGMGGGYYDRALQIRKTREGWRKPLLIGLAHDVQQSQLIENNAWDIPLDAIATESGLVWF
ncbi:MAG: 5-formyltetrahydrofolate cyclo-ligase, partial [Gammaproteobacteria bacterium]|nr:5-formyltetrahydrofolate cyclo-ligase [Gammaproteobacteria bacterium]